MTTQNAPDSATPDHIDLVEGYFDDNAQDWSDLYQRAKRVNDLVLADRRDFAVEFMLQRVPEGGHILDAGCGAGLTAVELARRGYRVHAVDVSAKMLELCEQNLVKAGVPRERFEVSRMDLAQSDPGENNFDGICALGFLQYQKDEVAALRALRRMLKPGGWLLITGPTSTRLSEYFGLAEVYYKVRRRLSRRKAANQAPPSEEAKQAARAAAEQRKLLHTISAHAYSPGRFKQLLRAAGFEYLGHKGHGFVNFAVINQRLGYRGELFLHRFFSGASRVLPISRWANDLMAMARNPER